MGKRGRQKERLRGERKWPWESKKEFAKRAERAGGRKRLRKAS